MSDEAEKASQQFADELFEGGVRSPNSTCAVIGFKDGYKRGRASRDAEMVAGDELVESLREQIAARDAVIERVRAYAEDRAFHARGHLNTVNSGRIASDLQAILAASPVSVLVEDYTVELGGQTFSKAQWDAVQTYAKGTSSPAEYRKGAGQ